MVASRGCPDDAQGVLLVMGRAMSDTERPVDDWPREAHHHGRPPWDVGLLDTDLELQYILYNATLDRPLVGGGNHRVRRRFEILGSEPADGGGRWVRWRWTETEYEFFLRAFQGLLQNLPEVAQSGQAKQQWNQ